MPQRPDLRQISGNIREALADYDRDALLAVLTYVFKEYVVEGPPPMLVNQAERIEDFEQASFAQLITALQTRFDHPELSMFQVEGDTVSVRVQGVWQPLSGSASAAASRRGVAQPVAAASSPDPAAPAAEPPRPQPGVSVVETTLTRRPSNPGERVSVTDAVARGRRDLAGAGAQGEAPRARRGLSIGARPTSPGGTMMPTAERSTQSAANPTNASGADKPAPAPAEAPAKDSSADDASKRFSLLEFD